MKHMDCLLLQLINELIDMTNRISKFANYLELIISLIIC